MFAFRVFSSSEAQGERTGVVLIEEGSSFALLCVETKVVGEGANKRLIICFWSSFRLPWQNSVSTKNRSDI